MTADEVPPATTRLAAATPEVRLRALEALLDLADAAGTLDRLDAAKQRAAAARWSGSEG